MSAPVKPMPGPLSASLAGGIAASLAMDLVQGAFGVLSARGRAEGDRDEEVEAIASVVRILANAAPGVFPRRYARAQAYAVHYAFGVAFAAAYVTGVTRAPWLAASRGVAFGSGLFLLSDRILIPALKLGRSWARYSKLERANALLAHVAYGVVLEGARRYFVRG
jgi:hypothetical protein